MMIKISYTYVYEYDKAGNRTSRKKYAYTTGSVASLTPTATQTLNYTTGAWGDQLANATYDALGNPLTYNGYAMTWNGRQLMEMNMAGGQFKYTFTYNDEGLQTSKTASGVTHKYVWEGSTLVSESWGSNLLIYLYDESGSPIGMQYRTTSYAANVFDTFYFEKNLQGDVIAVYNASGVKVLSYTYDAWGNHTTTWHNSAGTNLLATYNPFRYRGYYYDTETQLYYLQSRYYNPAWGRFLNADGLISTGTGLLGYNMYAYCNNNPVMYIDRQGKSLFAILALVVIGGLVLSLSSCDITDGGSLENTPMDPRPDDVTYHDNPQDAITEGINYVINESRKSNWSREYGVAIVQYNESYYVDKRNDGGGNDMKCYIPVPDFDDKHYKLIAIIHSHAKAQQEPFKADDYDGGDWETYSKIYHKTVESYIIDYERHTETVRVRYLPTGTEDPTRWKYWEEP